MHRAKLFSPAAKFLERVLSLLLVSWQLARLPTIVFSRVLRVGARGNARARLRFARAPSRRSAPNIRSRYAPRAARMYVRADTRRAERVCERRRASYVTGTTSGRDVYVHALHAFLDRFLHREAPRGSGEHPKTEHAGYRRSEITSLRFFPPLLAHARNP